LFLALVANQESERERVETCTRLFQEACNDKEKRIRIYTSALTFAECACAQSEEAQRSLQAFMERECIVPLNLDREVGEWAATVQRTSLRDLKKKLPPRDAIHVASALYYDIPVLYTYDGDDIIPLNGKLFLSDGSPLVISEPIWQGPMTLFDLPTA
jgi:predicted nucleic acid-binding protein